jgi:ATP-dependent Zn protease
MRIVAAHECGHAIVYAALPTFPADLEVKIYTSMNNAGHLGHVSASITENLLRMPEFARWHMMLTLAGRMGEHQLHGEGSLGSLRDMTRWLEIAHLYLSNHCEGIYYSEPKNAAEMSHNQSLLEQLKSRQLILLREFFVQNKATHQAMTEHLLEHHSLDAEALKQWLGEIRIPAGFPQPKIESNAVDSDKE